MEMKTKDSGKGADKKCDIIYFVKYEVIQVDGDGRETTCKKDVKAFDECKRALDNRKNAMTFIHSILIDSKYEGRMIEGHKHLLRDSEQNGCKNPTYLSLELIIYNIRTNKEIIIPSIGFENENNDSEIQDFACEYKWYQDFNYETDDYGINVEDETGTGYDILATKTLDDEQYEKFRWRFDPLEYPITYFIVICNKSSDLDNDVDNYFGHNLISPDPIYSRFIALNFAHLLEKDLCNNFNDMIIQVYCDIDFDNPRGQYLIYDSRMDSDIGLANEIISNKAFEIEFLSRHIFDADGIECLINSEGNTFECVKETYITRILSDDFIEKLYNNMNWCALNRGDTSKSIHGYFWLGWYLIYKPVVY